MLHQQIGGRRQPGRHRRTSDSVPEPGTPDRAAGLLGHRRPPQWSVERPATAGKDCSLPDAADQRARLTRQVVGHLAALFSYWHRRPLSGASDLTLSQLRLLWLLEGEGPLALRSIASALGRSPATASQLVERLVRRGLVQRTEDPHDRRRIECQLTAAARERLGRIQAGDGGRLIRMLERLDAHELRRVAGGLGRLVAELDLPERATEPGSSVGSRPAANNRAAQTS